MKMTAVAGSESTSPSRGFWLREKLGKLHVFSLDRNNRWPVQGWSSGDESHFELDEQVVAEETARPFTLDKATRWPLQGWCKAHKPYSRHSSRRSSEVSTDAPPSHPSPPSRWPQGW